MRLAVAAVDGRGVAATAPIVYSSGRICTLQDSSNCADNARYNTAIYAIDRIGYPPRKLTTGRDSDSAPSWSPDHKRIAFQRFTNVNTLSQIWVMNADGSGQRQLTHAGSADSARWSPAGNKILYTGFYGRSSDEFWVVNANGTGRVRLMRSPRGSVYGQNADWSPDGKRVAFSLLDANGGIYVVRANGTGLKRLVAADGSPELRYPVWSPNGRKIAFVRNGDNIELWTMNADGTMQRKLGGPQILSSPAWSPDGTRIAYLGPGSVTVLRADGTGRRTTKVNVAGHPPVWSPDGSRIAFVVGGDNYSQVALMNANSGKIKQITRKKTNFSVYGLDW